MLYRSIRNNAGLIGLLIALTACLTLCGCVTVYNPATERRETLFMDTAAEVALGKELDTELHKKMKFAADPAQLARVRNIGQRVARYSDRQDLRYVFQVVEDTTLNAFAVPGGYVYIHSGLAQTANDAELAGVIAHEIGHIAARHSVKQLQGLMGFQLLMGIVTGASGQLPVSQALSVVFDLANLGYSRKDELLADKLAVRYTRRAGYSPLGIVTFFHKLETDAAQKGRSAPPVFLSSHPPTKQRIAQVEEEMRKR